MVVPRKIVPIRNFKEFNAKVTTDKAITVLENGLIAILNSQQPLTSLQELYGIIENLYNTHRIVLFDKLQDILEEALLHRLDMLLSKPQDLLVEMNKLWIEFCKQINTIKNIYLNADRSSKNNNKYNTVQQLGMNLFQSIILIKPSIKNCLTIEILHLIQMQRNGDKIDIQLIKSTLEMLTELQIYEDVFQAEFLKMSQIFYADEANILINMIDIRTYLKHTEARIREEYKRSKNYLNKYTYKAVLNIVHENLVKDHLTEILDKTFELLFKNQLEKELGTLYILLVRLPLGLKTLSEYFTNYVINKGNIIVNKTDNDKTMIQELLDFKDTLDHIVKEHFRGHEAFNDIIRNSFVKFINEIQNKPAQLLAKYIDVKLRAKNIPEDELEIIFSKVIVLFRYIHGKDIFEAFYKKALAKRLLLGKSTSQDAETSMIGKLKSECGPAFTSKIEGMFKDINISQSMNNAFRHHLSHTCSPMSSDWCINILTSGFWPNYPTYKVNLPPELLNYQVNFQNFYATNHSGRQLVWQPNLGHCIVKAVFESGNKELQVSLFQTIVLLLFNDSNQLSFGEILELTSIESEELKRTLISLACTKSRVLLRQTKGQDINNEDIFCFNSKFKDKLFRVKINQIQLKESVEEYQATEKSVLADRQFQIDAAIVRILKNKKKINHNELISELFNTLDVPVKPYDLKKRIELLIEREYLERDKDDPSNYTYIA